MIERIINDINKALDAEAYMAALSLVLTLPDICAKAEYGDKIGKKNRYIKWYDEYIGQYMKAPTEPGETIMPYLSGEVVYQLRCSVLHQGAPNIDSTKIEDENCKIDEFSLIVEKKKPFDAYADASHVSQQISPTSGRPIRGYEVNIRRLCFIITRTAQKYYEKNQSKFDFFHYQIIDWDEEMKNIFGDNQ